jgi:serine/threonine protein kinase/Tfp pilus assembly protein PilF
MIGETILHYHIIKELGRGGMGIVYLAEDTKLKREVAIKFLPQHISSDQEQKQRFELEAQAAASLNHPNISTIHAIEESDNDIFIVMEYIDGIELKDKIKSGTVTVEDTVRIAIQIAEGLEAAHRKGIVHRDIKSQNIMITNDGKVKIMDFGLAKVRGGAQLTKVGSTLGTAAYMSPEQARGGELDNRTDIWSFGVVLYEMITGKLPFRGDYEQSVLYSIVHEDPVGVSEISECPPVLDKIIMRCLGKDVQKRYQNITDVLTDLRSILDPNTKSLLSVKRSSFGISVKGNRKRISVIILGIIVFVILLLLLIKNIPVFESSSGNKSEETEHHLAILPLVDIDGTASTKAFCNGLMETLTSKLTQLQQFHKSLWVIPLSEVLHNKIKSPGEANQLFGVNLVVTGSLQQINKEFRLTLNLIDAKNLRQLNSSVIDVNEEDLIKLQNKSVISLIEMLNIELNPESSGMLDAGNTDVPEAYEYYVLGRGYLQNQKSQNDVEAAINSFLLAIQRDSLYAMAHSGLAEAYWAKYNLVKKPEWADKAVKESEYAYKLNNKLAYVNVTRGNINDGIGRYKDAIKDFNRALEINPISYEAYQGLAKAYEGQGLIDDAERTFKRAIDMQPDNWIGYNSLGVFYYKHARYNDAISQFEKVIQLNPNNYKGFSNIGGMYYFQHKLKKASEMFKKAFSIKNSYTVASNLGTLSYIQGEYSKAAGYYEQALEIDDHDYVIWGNLGSAYYWAPGERVKASEAFRHAVKLAEQEKKVNPNDSELLCSLGGFYSMIGERTKALEDTKRSLELSPDNASIMYRAGTTYEQLGDREEAIRWIIKAIRKGYSRSEIENEPELKNLISDEKYKKLVSGL